MNGRRAANFSGGSSEPDKFSTADRSADGVHSRRAWMPTPYAGLMLGPSIIDARAEADVQVAKILAMPIFSACFPGAPKNRAATKTRLCLALRTPGSIDFAGAPPHKTGKSRPAGHRRRLSFEVNGSATASGECPERQRGRTVNPDGSKVEVGFAPKIPPARIVEVVFNARQRQCPYGR